MIFLIGIDKIDLFFKFIPFKTFIHKEQLSSGLKHTNNWGKNSVTLYL